MASSLRTGVMAPASKTQQSVLCAYTSRPAIAGRSRSMHALQGAIQLRSSRMVARARSSGSGQDVDFDKILSDIADKFENSDNKAAIVGYSAAAIGALWFSEWLIHLPLLNFLLGFPIQLLGLALLPYFGVKYFVEKDSFTNDAGDAFNKVVRRLPGLEK